MGISIARRIILKMLRMALVEPSRISTLESILKTENISRDFVVRENDPPRKKQIERLGW